MKSAAVPIAILAASIAVVIITAVALAGAQGLVSAQDNSVGEMLLDEGLRYEQNGALELALQKYRLAEQALFQGAKNLRHLHFQLALHTAGDEAAEYFEKALEDDALVVKEPSLWRKAWEGHCTALAGRGDWPGLDAALKDWEAREQQVKEMLRNESGRCAAARDYYRGLAAQEAGELEAAEQFFRRAYVDGHAAPRLALAELLHVRGGNREIIQRLKEEAEVMNDAPIGRLAFPGEQQ